MKKYAFFAEQLSDSCLNFSQAFLSLLPVYRNTAFSPKNCLKKVPSYSLNTYVSVQNFYCFFGKTSSWKNKQL
jgi:hypothetical protein